MMGKAEIARQNFLSGCNCAQSVLCAFETECGLDHETALKLASGFGAGMSRLRETCGAVSGMFMAAGLIFGPADPTDKAAKDAHYAELQKLAGEFRKATGSIICRVMLGLDHSGPETPVSEARTEAYYRKRPCPDLCALAAGILEKYLNHELS